MPANWGKELFTNVELMNAGFHPTYAVTSKKNPSQLGIVDNLSFATDLDVLSHRNKIVNLIK